MPGDDIGVPPALSLTFPMFYDIFTDGGRCLSARLVCRKTKSKLFRRNDGMKVVILAGGFGTRISEESAFKPKPMLEIGGMPILWHIMKNYSHYGFNEFVICAGYKQHVIKEWFADYFLHTSDITFDYTNGNSALQQAQPLVSITSGQQ